MLLALAIGSLLLAALPAVLMTRNLRAYRPPPEVDNTAQRAAISLLIPARNEAGRIGDAVAAALESRGVELEVVVLDDHSTDSTADIVRRYAQQDRRVRLVSAPPLPDGWCGKQHACFVLAGLARHRLLVFTDGDVRLQPQALAQLAEFLDRSGAALISGVPKQETVTLGEKVLIPLIHFLLLGFLPVQRMRASTLPAYGAGCGQLFMTRREAYFRAGGHAAIRRSLHDGLTLPRAYRQVGLMTDLVDATGAATCRMYESTRETIAGLAKNAVEGIGSPKVILQATLLLAGGHLLPWVLLGLSIAGRASLLAGVASIAAIAVSYWPRITAAERFEQSLLGVILHPLGIAMLLVIQWVALARWLCGRPAGWKGRTYLDVSPSPECAAAAPAQADEAALDRAGARRG